VTWQPGRDKIAELLEAAELQQVTADHRVARPTGWKLRGPGDHVAGNPGITPHDRDAGAPARRGCAAVQYGALPRHRAKPALPPYGQPSRV